MKKLTILPLLLSVFVSTGQTTIIPDVNFEQALISQGYDVGPTNGSVPTANIDTISTLIIPAQNIIDLTGIEDFTTLSYLNCLNNSITSLNLSQNFNLSVLLCGLNQITSLDLTQNINLTQVTCLNNNLNCLNLKNGNNTSIFFLNATNNPNLTCIEVDNVSYSTTNWTLIDAQTSYSNNCNNACSTVGINEVSPNTSISAYPNPTSGHITISIEGKASGVIVRNSLGQLLLYDKIEATNQLELDISAYPNGIYFLQVELDGQVITKKVVKK